MYEALGLNSTFYEVYRNMNLVLKNGALILRTQALTPSSPTKVHVLLAEPDISRVQ